MTAGPPNPEPLRPALTRLTAERATGALRVGGATGGTIWLVDGTIRYADTPVMPGVGERLTASGRLTERTWQQAYRDARHGGDVTDALVGAGHLAHGELAARVLATVYDAAYLMLADEAAPARFHPGLRHWLGDITAVGAAELDAELDRRRALLADDLSGGTAPLVPSVPRAAARPVAVASAGPDGPAVPVVPGDGVDAAISEAEEITSPTGPVTAVYVVAGVADEPTGELPMVGSGTAPAPAQQPPGRNGRAALPKRQAGAVRGNAGQNAGLDYATLRRIRMALKSIT
ncbi:hypothetical protein [Spirilliplanes yamanashiensis]|uniref:Uncharacterized protein n=1 Tax=Spirilliplanes yamanashiensis TaxID=42233 RepID=A0A8J3YCD2_9ACTN|nr:hypothetical protein [Spirilliplanes yamanashiensis]MDP9816554.1 hypothetical protein [Spirilliplanes yamanashiensis]GIJ06081.1 hypothetical protein Sya03_54330 [Spirilliplanes yamanashiensis]